MQIRVFTIPIADSGSLQSEMNAFLSAHRVLEIEQKFFQNESGGCWTFCVRYINGGAAAPAQSFGYSGKKDYREVLEPEIFSIFTKLRAIRKEITAADGTPPYALFTDAELAGIARLPEITEKTLLTIKGVGEKKVAKYGKTFVEKYNALVKAEEDALAAIAAENAEAKIVETSAQTSSANLPFKTESTQQ